MSRTHPLAGAGLTARTALALSLAGWRLKSGRLPWRSRRADRRRRRARARWMRRLRRAS
jgi:hypothetical protein